MYKPWIAKHRAELSDFLKGLIAGIAYVKNPANEPEALKIAAQHLKLPGATLKPGFELYRDKMFQTYPVVSKAGMQTVLKLAAVKKPVGRFYDNSFIRQLETEKFAQTVKS